MATVCVSLAPLDPRFDQRRAIGKVLRPGQPDMLPALVGHQERADGQKEGDDDESEL